MSRLAKKINEKLQKGIVVFKFLETDRKTVREARGTLFEGILKNRREAAETGKPTLTSSPNVQVFFDLSKNAWCSFQLGTEIEIVEFFEY